MSENERKEIDILNDLKSRLWEKIQILDDRLKSIDEKSEEYRKALDAYQKITKSYLDIVKVQRYTPGSLVAQSIDDIVKLLRKVKEKETVAKANKVALQEFKDFLNSRGKASLVAQKKVRRGGKELVR